MKFSSVRSHPPAAIALARCLGALLFMLQMADAQEAAPASPQKVSPFWNPPSPQSETVPPGTKPNVGTAAAENHGFGKPGTKSEKLGEDLAKRIKTAIDNHVTERLGPVGPKGEGGTDLPAEGALLVGFEYVNGSFKGEPMVKSMKPLFLTASGIVTGNRRGHTDKPYKVIKAKEGFAVSGMIVNPGKERLGGFQLVFARIKAGPSAPGRAETYKSEWLGGELKKGAVVLGGVGKLGIGIFGANGADVDSIGLIVAP